MKFIDIIIHHLSSVVDLRMRIHSIHIDLSIIHLIIGWTQIHITLTCYTSFSCSLICWLAEEQTVQVMTIWSVRLSHSWLIHFSDQALIGRTLSSPRRLLSDSFDRIHIHFVKKRQYDYSIWCPRQLVSSKGQCKRIRIHLGTKSQSFYCTCFEFAISCSRLPWT